MNIFKKRPLSLILCIMLGGFSLFASFGIRFKLVVAASLLTLFAASFIFDHKFVGRIGLMKILLAAFSVAILLSAAWSYSFYPAKYYNESVSIEGRIYDIDTYSYNSKVVIKTNKISDRRDKHKLILYVDRDTAMTLRKYDVVELSATVYSFSTDEDTYNGSNYYVGKGISAYLADVENISVRSNEPDKIDRFLSDISLKLSNTLKKRSDFETGAFLSALIIGNRDDLDGNTRLNFSRALCRQTITTSASRQTLWE